MDVEARAMLVRIVNWRCIDSLELELSKVNVLIGGNSTGKSSVAYALYFFSKLPGFRDPNRVLDLLYAANLDSVARVEGGRPVYPVVVEVGGARFEARSVKSYSIPGEVPWSDSIILPSERIGFVRLLGIYRKAREWWGSEARDERWLILFSAGFLDMLSYFVSPRFILFADDLARLVIGRRLLESVEGGSTGRLLFRISPILSLVELSYEDPYTGLELPVEQAPDGAIDALLIRRVVERAPRGSLVVVEEPENHKNPGLLIELAKYVARSAVEKEMTLVMTSHNTLLLHAVAKLVEEQGISPEDVAVHYLERGREGPWTRARRIAIYSDGTFEELPGLDKVLLSLF